MADAPGQSVARLHHKLGGIAEGAGELTGAEPLGRRGVILPCTKTSQKLVFRLM